MNQNISRIRAGLAALSAGTPEIISGTVVAGSVNATTKTCSVQPFTGGRIDDVLLSAISGSDSGLILYPAENSHVVIGSINGPGQWVVLMTSEVDSCVIAIGDATCEILSSGIRIARATTVIDLADAIKIATATESLRALLLDLVDGITALTVNTSGVPSTVPVNVASFTALIPRINNLLAS